MQVRFLMKNSALMLCLFLSACANGPADSIALTQSSDLGSTIAGLQAGGVEANPLGMYTLPLKAGLVAASYTLPCHEVAGIEPAVSGLGWFATGNNLAVALAASGPQAPAIGAGALVAFLLYRDANPLDCEIDPALDAWLDKYCTDNACELTPELRERLGL